MDLAPEDESGRSLLTSVEEGVLALRIEAGVLAAAALREGRRPHGSTTAELEHLIAEGDAARHRFTEANLGLVGMVARQLTQRSGVNQADVFQEACLGLLMAVLRFDCRRGFRFATYALFWIRAYAGAASARMLGDLNLPTSRATQLRALRGVEAALEQSLGRVAAPRDVAAAVGRPETWVAEVLAHTAPASLSAVDLDQHRSATSPLEARPTVEAAVLLAELSSLERAVLELRLGFVTGEPLSYAAIARRLQLGVSRIRRLEHVAVERLRAVCPYDPTWAS